MHLPGYEDVVEMFTKRGFPYLIVDTPCRLEGRSQILLDHRRAAREAVTHLLDHGRRRIAAITGPVGRRSGPQMWSASKLDGYRDALKEAGAPRPAGLAVELQDPSVETARAATRELARSQEFDGLFIAAGSVATHVIDELRARGRLVPHDVAVVSFNVREYEQMASDAYAVTGMDVPRVETGGAAVRFLTRILEDESLRPPHLEEIPIALVRRRSCGCA
jgi:DNA-binding LacI/PurR family transcriptional regulator